MVGQDGTLKTAGWCFTLSGALLIAVVYLLPTPPTSAVEVIGNTEAWGDTFFYTPLGYPYTQQAAFGLCAVGLMLQSLRLETKLRWIAAVLAVPLGWCAWRLCSLLCLALIELLDSWFGANTSLFSGPFGSLEGVAFTGVAIAGTMIAATFVTIWIILLGKMATRAIAAAR